MKNKNYLGLKDELKTATLREKLLNDPEQVKKEKFNKLKDFILNMLDLKKENNNMAKSIVGNESHRLLLNRLTMQIEADLNDGMSKNGLLKTQADQMIKLKESHENHRNKAFSYCSTLKSKLKSFVETVRLLLISR
jgi:hypothetical protein